MAELLGRDFTRGFLKKFLYGRDRLYLWEAARAWDVARFEDDFTGPVIDTNHWTVGNGGGAGATSPAVSAGVANGIIQLVTGTAGDNTASSTLAGGRNFRGDLNAVIVARVNLTTATTNVKLEVGFRDAITTTAAAHAVVNVMATPTFTSTDGVVWCYDTNNTGTGWQGLGVAGGTAATTDTGFNVAADINNYEYLSVALVDGTAYFSHFDVNGKLNYGPKAMALAVTKTVLLSPHITIEARSATSKSLNVDWVLAYQGRTTS